MDLSPGTRILPFKCLMFVFNFRNFLKIPDFMIVNNIFSIHFYLFDLFQLKLFNSNSFSLSIYQLSEEPPPSNPPPSQSSEDQDELELPVSYLDVEESNLP